MAKKTDAPEAPATQPPSSLSLWLEDALPGWVVPATVVAVVVGGGALYIFDFLPERFTALTLAVLISIFCAGYIGRDLLGHAHRPVQRLVVYGATLAVFALTFVPAFLTIVPGEALATGSVTATGDSLTLPDGVAGPVRLLVHGKIGGVGEASVEFELDGAKAPIVGKLERTQSSQRAGRRGTATVSHEHDADFLSAVIPADAKALKLTRLDGQLSGDLHFEIFRDRWPVWIDTIAAAVALLVVAMLAARQSVKSSAAAIAGLALCFGVLVQVLATPDVAVRAQIGALILAALGGSVVGTLFGSIAKKVTARFDT